eukprot:g3282.t1
MMLLAPKLLRPAVRRSMASSSARAFIEKPRVSQSYRPAAERVNDWGEIFADEADALRPEQAQRCMDCGTPFCQTSTGCPIDNIIPEWNQHAAAGQWRQAWEKLRKTNNFAEFTSRVCPAPCEGACVAGIAGDAVTIKNTEQVIVDEAWKNGWVKPRPPAMRSGLRVSIVGSGPAGLAAADELNQLGHLVTVYEREDTVGGLLHYGIPNMKLDKGRVAARVGIMEAEGVRFNTGVAVGGSGGVDAHSLRATCDALVLAIGSTVPRDLDVAGREGSGVHFAMEYLTKSQKALRSAAGSSAVEGSGRRLQGRNGGSGDGEGLRAVAQSAWGNEALHGEGKHVVVIGGGDTGTDCIATALRQDALSVTNLEILQRPPEERDASANPWPEWPRVFRVDYGHEEAARVFGEDPRLFGVQVKGFHRGEDGALQGLSLVGVDAAFQEVEGSEQELPCDLALLSMGFVGAEKELIEELKLAETRDTGTLDAAFDGDAAFATSVDSVFAAGDCRRGQSLVVWAINEGRGVAKAVQRSFEAKGLLRTKLSQHRVSSSLEDWMGGSFFTP